MADSNGTDRMAGKHRDPYEVLGIQRDATDQQIKTAYRKMALKLHPDKNPNSSEAVGLFNEVTYAYGILSDPNKRRQYDSVGFEGMDLDPDGLGMELDLSSLNAVNTMFAALFSKLGVPIKTAVSANVLEDALNGTATIRPLSLGQPVHDKVEKQHAHFYSISISNHQAQSGVIIRAISAAQNKLKLLYFEPEGNGLGLAVQEDSMKAGKLAIAGMYFLHFQVYRLDPTINALAMAKDQDAALFRRLDGFQPCEMSELKPGTHVFAVYGDNFFKSTSYTVEAMCADNCKEVTEKLKAVEQQILEKRNELHQFETEYREILARFNAVTARYMQEKQAVDDLLKEREKAQESFSGSATARKNYGPASFDGSGDAKDESISPNETQMPAKSKDKKRKWFNIKADKK